MNSRNIAVLFMPTLTAGLLVLLLWTPTTSAGAPQVGANQLQVWEAPARAARKKNPVPADSASIAQGKGVYARECLSCHGATGRGDGPNAKDLSDVSPGDLSSATMWQQSDGALFWKITEGKAPMASYKALLSDEQRWQVVNYVRTLAPPLPLTKPEFSATDSQRQAISAVLKASCAVSDALAKGDAAAAQATVAPLSEAVGKLSAMPVDPLDARVRTTWKECLESLTISTVGLSKAADLATLRAAFSTFSTAMSRVLAAFGHAETEPAVQFRCESAVNGNEATWIQADLTPRNPYVPDKLPACATPTRRFAAQASQPSAPGT